MEAYLIEETRAFSTEYNKGVTRANTDILFIIPNKDVFAKIPLSEVGEFFRSFGGEGVCKYFNQIPDELSSLRNLEKVANKIELQEFIRDNQQLCKSEFSYYPRRIIDIPPKDAKILADFVDAKKRLNQIDTENFIF